MKSILLCVCLCHIVASSAFAQTIESDTSWKSSKEVSEGWTTTDFDDSEWDYAIGPTRGTCRYYDHPVFFVTPIWSPLPKEKEKVYVRRKFSMDYPSNVSLRALFDDDGEIYINGHHIYSDRSGGIEDEPILIDVSEYVNVGENVIAIEATDSYGGCQWIQVQIVMEKDESVLDVPMYKQNDVLWTDYEYDSGTKQELFCGTTIGDCGCAMTSIAMILSYYGVDKLPSGEDVNPKLLNQYFNSEGICNQSGCTSKGYVYGNVRWNAVNALTKEAHDIYDSAKVQYVAGGSFDEKIYSEDISQRKPVILKDSTISHWFVGKSIHKNIIHINDPLFERQSVLEASQVRRFEVVNSDFSLIDVYVKAPGHVTITDMFGRSAGNSEDSRSIPRSQYIFEESYSPNSTSAGGIMWLSVQRPIKGIYTLESDAELVVYTSDTYAHESKHVLKPGRYRLYYSRENNDASFIFPSQSVCTIQRYYQ